MQENKRETILFDEKNLFLYNKIIKQNMAKILAVL